MNTQENCQFGELAVVEIPFDILEEWGVPCAEVADVEYDKLMKVKTGEWKTLIGLVDLLNTSADFSNIENSVYVIVNTVEKKVIGSEFNFVS